MTEKASWIKSDRSSIKDQALRTCFVFTNAVITILPGRAWWKVHAWSSQSVQFPARADFPLTQTHGTGKISHKQS
jgi:hypothetical protein